MSIEEDMEVAAWAKVGKPVVPAKRFTPLATTLFTLAALCWLLAGCCILAAFAA